MIGIETKVIGVIYLKIYDDAEKTAERIDKLIRKLPMKYRICLERQVDDNPYTKEPEGRYISDKDSD